MSFENGDTIRFERAGTVYEAEIAERGLKEKFLDEVGVSNDSATKITECHDEVFVEPAYEGSGWLESEFLSIAEADDWYISYVEKGEHGPRVFVRYTGVRNAEYRLVDN